MKKFLFYFLTLLILPLASCSSDEPTNPDPDIPNLPDDPSQPVPDPAGTVTLNIVNDGKEYSIGEDFKLSIDQGNNFFVDGNTYYRSYDMVDVGEVAGLGNVVEIPTTGWKQNTAVIPGHGYVLRKTYSPYNASVEFTYARVYVMEYMGDVTGGILGATIKYQCPFQLPIAFDKKTVEFAADGEGLTQTLTLKYHTTLSVAEERPVWLQSYTLYGKKLILTVRQNFTTSSRTGSLVLSNSEGEMTLTLTQAGASTATFAGGSGTQEDPYQIATATQLHNVRLSPESCFKLTADIDLSNYLNANGTGWEPIMEFTGRFDGAMHTVKELWINTPNVDYIGLFGSARQNAVIERLRVETSDKGITGQSWTAGIVGSASEEVQISQCCFKGSINGTPTYTFGICGGQGISVSECYAEISGHVAAGITYSGITINCYVVSEDEDCSWDCLITSNGSAYNCYGIFSDPASYPYWPAISNSYHHSGCYAANRLSDNGSNRGYSTLDDLRQQSTFAGWDFVNIWKIQDGVSFPTLRCFK